MKAARRDPRQQFLRDLVGSASVDWPAPGARARVLDRLGLEAPAGAWPRTAAGAVLVTALALVFGAGLRAASPGAPEDARAVSTAGTSPECTGGLEAPELPCEDGARAGAGAGSSSGSTAPGSSGG